MRRGGSIRRFRACSVLWCAAAVLAGCGSVPAVTPLGEERVGAPPSDPLDPAGLGGWDQVSGRFELEVTMGSPATVVATTRVRGVFDHASGDSEIQIELRDLVDQLPPEAGVVLPEEIADDLIVRVVDGFAYVRVGTPDREWVVNPVASEDGAAEFDLYRPDRLLALIEAAAHDVTVSDGGRLDGVPTRLHSGWLDGSGLRGLSLDGAPSGLGAMAAAHPPGLFDRVVRFDLWLGSDGLPRRLVIELDPDGLIEVAERIEGPQPPDAAVPVLRWRVDWFDLGQAVAIEAPPSEQVSVIDLGTGPASG
jgi:hypothetical protein